MNLLLKIGLVKKLDNGELYMTQVENMIGSQSKSAFKKQQQRLNKTLLIGSGQKVDKCPPDIEKEIEKEKEVEINKKEINKENNYFENAEINSLFVEFLELRKKLKAVNSDRAIKMLINKLNKYDDEVKREMIERSILNSWKDVYEIKQHNKATNDFSGVAEAIRERSKAEEHDEDFYKNLNF